MHIYDTKRKDKVLFEPIKKGEVRLYVCGPTVYDDSHLGHARSALAFDLLRRTLIANGFNVTFVKNFTDIDDKIINKIKQTGMDLPTLTNQYIKSYKHDMHLLGVKDADMEPKATQSIDFIIDFISKLLENGSAYKISDGVYFDTSKDKEYLSLSHQNLDESRSRVGENDEKKDSKDFAIWKNFDKSEIGFDSPFGYGRPGWHIECSAMIDHFLAYDGEYQIDIHAGGADLLFPHHENEAAQTRCGCDQVLAKYWMHNGFVTINGEKMSKSLGNSFFLKDALKAYHPEVLRFYLISTHYRSDFNFSEVDLLKSKKRLDKLYRLKKRINTQKSSAVNKEFKSAVIDALNDDLNISKALSFLDEMITNANETLDNEPKNKSKIYEINANLEFIRELLGLGEAESFSYFQQGVSEEEKKEIKSLIAKRDEAKSKKDFSLADEIREQLSKKGVSVMDTPNGTLWEKSE